MNARNPFPGSPLSAALFLSTSLVLAALTVLVLYQVWGQSIIADAYHGRSWPLLNQLMAEKSGHSLEHYYSRAEKPLYRFVIAMIVMSPLFLALHFWRVLDRHRIAVLVTLGTLVLFLSGWISIIRALWYDELFTYYTSRAESPVAVVNSLLNGGDNHPPMDYITRHYSMALFGDSPLAFRLPSLLSAIIASICLYLFARRRTPFFAAAVAFAVPFSSFAITYSYEGRAYMPMFALACMALLAWQRVVEQPANPARLALLAVSLALAPFFHFYGVFNLVPILIGEAARTIQARKICWPLVISVGVSQLSLVMLYPFLMQSIGFSSNFWTSVTPVDLVIAYGRAMGLATIAFLGLLAVYLLFRRMTSGRRTLDVMTAPFPLHELAAILTYCLVPVMLYMVAELVTGAFIARYAIIAVAGIALVICLIVDRIEASNRGYAAAIMMFFWLAALANLGAAAVPFMTTPPGHANMVKVIETELAGERIPIVIPHAHRYLETYYYLPEDLRDRIVFIADSALAIEYQGFDTAELGATNLKRQLPINAFMFCEFAQQSPHFIVLGKGGWLMGKLEDDGANISSTEIRGVTVYRVMTDVGSTCP